MPDEVDFAQLYCFVDNLEASEEKNKEQKPHAEHKFHVEEANERSEFAKLSDHLHSS
jgi:hypothetical protein